MSRNPFSLPKNETIRLAKTDEVDIIKDIVFRAYSSYIKILGRKPAPMDDDYCEKVLEKSLHVLLVNDEIIGFIVIYCSDDAVLIENVATDPAYQGKGFGSKLMRFAESIAVKEKITSIALYTNELMTKNIRIYTNMGYIFTHKSEYNGLKRIHMRKTLC